MNKKKSTNYKVWIVAAILAVASCIAFIGATKNGITLDSNNAKGIKTYSSISEMQSDINLNIRLSDYILNNCNNISIESVSGQMITIYGEINSTAFVLKTAAFVDKGADTLGLYEDSQIQVAYNTVNSDINYVVYRQGYIEYPNCTIINWCTNETAYGMMIESLLDESSILEIIGIQDNNIVKAESAVQDNKNSDTSTNYNVEYFDTYNVFGKYFIKLPEFNTEVTHIDTAEASAFFAGDTLLFIVTFDETDSIKNEYSEYSRLSVNDRVAVYYLDINTYDPDTIAYNDYDIMLNTIDSICSTIVMEDN